MAQDVAGRRPRALAHLVRERRRPPREAAARHPARRHRAQPRAAAAVEGRAARRRLPGLQLDREDRVRGGGCRHRRERRHAPRHPALLSGARRAAGARRAQRHRPRRAGSRVDDDELVRALGIDPDRPSVVFVGRITRQKGLPYLLRAAALLPPDVQLVLCAGAPDTPEILAEVQAGVARAAGGTRSGVVWIDRLLSQHELLRRAHRRDDLRLPVDLRAARHRQPRGDGVRCRRSSAPRPAASPRSSTTGSPGGWCRSSRSTTAPARPLDPDRFVADLAAALTEVVADPAAATAMGAAGRARAEREFSWDADRRAHPRDLPLGLAADRRGRRDAVWRIGAMASVLQLSDVSVVRRWQPHPRFRRLDGRGRPALGHPRPERRRQDHAAAGRRRHASTRRPARPSAARRRRSARSTCSSCARASASPRPRWPRRIPRDETVLDVVLTAAYSVTGRWNEEYEDIDEPPRPRVLAEWNLDAPRRPPLRHAQRRRAEARADRARGHDRPRAAAARRAGRQPRPRRPRGAAAAARRLRQRPAESPAIVMVTHHVEEIPRGFTHALLLADGEVHGGRPDRRGPHRREPQRRLRPAASSSTERRRPIQPRVPHSRCRSDTAR